MPVGVRTGMKPKSPSDDQSGPCNPCLPDAKQPGFTLSSSVHTIASSVLMPWWRWYLGWKVTPRGYSGSLPEILSLYEIWRCKKPAWRSLKKVNRDGFWVENCSSIKFSFNRFKLIIYITKTNRLSQTILSNQVLRSF